MVHVYATLSQNSQEHTENRENTCDNCITGGYRLPTDNRLVWLHRSYGPGNIRGFHACNLSVRYFMPRSHESLTQSTVRAKPVPVGNHTICIASPNDVLKNAELCGRRIAGG